MNTTFSSPSGIERGGVHRLGDVLPAAVANLLNPQLRTGKDRDESPAALTWSGSSVLVEQLSVQLVHA